MRNRARDCLRAIAGDPSCVLFLPMINGIMAPGKIQDLSRYGNHGTVTGCVPGQVPILGEELLVNGGFETLGTGGFGTWVEAAAGSSTVNVENSVIVAGSNSCRLDIDGSNNTVYVINYTSTTVGAWYQLAFWYRTTSTNTASFMVHDGTQTNYYNFTTGLWQGTPAPVGLAASNGFWSYVRAIIPAAYASTGIQLKRNTSTSQSIYFDEVSLKLIQNFDVRGVYFDGVDDNINCGTDASVLPDAWTMIAWVIPVQVYSQLVGVTAGASGCFIAYPYAAAGDAFKPLIYLAAGNYRYFARQPLGIFEDTLWQHHAITVPGAAQGDIVNSAWYIDGRPLAASTTVQTGPQDTKTLFKIGNTSEFKGYMAFATLYNRVLTHPEIVSHYNLTRPFIGV